MAPLLVEATVTKLPTDAQGAVLVTGSHGGRYAAWLAAKAGVRALVFHDAGVGKDRAALAALDLFGALPAAAVGHGTARVGDATDMMARGRVSFRNDAAAALGVEAGMQCAEAAERFRAAPARRLDLPEVAEARAVERPTGAVRNLVLIDSASLVDAVEDAGAVVVAGSHGGLVGGRPEMALRADAFGAAFHDAGIGIEQAGIGRLAALQARGIAALAVAAETARIGEARSVLDGVISAVNARAASLGAAPGRSARAVLLAWTRIS